MNEDHESSGGGSPSAPWDDPALYVRLRREQERNRYRDGGQHATSSEAPEALDLRLLAPALACWAGAGWASRQLTPGGMPCSWPPGAPPWLRRSW